jgi:hypothetical protein
VGIGVVLGAEQDEKSKLTITNTGKILINDVVIFSP